MSEIVHDIQEKLWRAAEQGDCGAIRSLVMKGADIGARDDRQRTAINIATQYGHVEAVTTLLAVKKMKYMMDLGMTPEEMLPETKGAEAQISRKKQA